MADSLTKYTDERAELLAKLILTRRKDLQLVSFEDRQDLGIDMIIRMSNPQGAEELVAPYFAAQIMGVSDPLENEEAATKYASRNWKRRPAKSLWLCPILVMLFTVEGDVGYYSWLMEPDVGKEDEPSLTRVSSPSMRKLNNKAVDEIIERVREWFEAMSDLLVRHASGK